MRNTGWAKGNLPDSDEDIVDEICSEKESCVLDVADRGGATLEEIGDAMGITRERVRQLEGDLRAGKRLGIMSLRQPTGIEKIKQVSLLKVFSVGE